MRRALTGLILAAVMAAPLSAQSTEQSAAIETVIQQQIDAFLQDDFTTAFDFASPSIQRMFRTPETFAAMVMQGYPMVWRPASVSFGELWTAEGALWQRVIVTDDTGQTHELAYRMEQTGDRWTISAVQIIARPQVAA
ncbi:DUF4864 domain-containing protein [Cognatishimia sp. F0-27]|uniref:DUF4864 domain-containing protein n=1 Tax=Cognatishimia sp. F0-27 TaxID=2816855 RepID=UPI001D0CD2F0|nr:DUF4864 domain-containing protein [Cognatishimia sp. F0-27]MCC1492825.1 DUF4864 domain-containing protein [Cognatishimia sp. F0-27]